MRFTWKQDLAVIAGALVACVLVGLLRYGKEIFSPSEAAFQLLEVGVLGSVTFVAFRRAGWIGAAILAVVIVIVQYLIFQRIGHRIGWPALVFSLVVAATIVLSAWIYHLSRGVLRFGRFIPVSVVIGLGFLAGTTLLGSLLRLEPMGLSMRINFAVGSLAGAAMALGFELVEMAQAYLGIGRSAR
ncbi:MAG: hypothetical protein ACE15D_10210 [Candidatus Eisenbacteria bacterium]